MTLSLFDSENMEETALNQDDLNFDAQTSVIQRAQHVVSFDIPYEEMEFPLEFVLTTETKVLICSYNNNIYLEIIYQWINRKREE